MILLYNSSKLMEKQKVSFQLLELQKLLNIPPGGGSDTTDLKLQIFRCKNNFYGEIQRNILLAKNKIATQIHGLIERVGEQIISESQLRLLRSLRNKLNVLNGDIDYLLNQGLLSLYMELNDLKKQALCLKTNGFMSDMAKMAIDSLGNLLKQYFVFQQYQIRKKQEDEQKQIDIFSLRSIPLNVANKNQDGNIQKIDQKILKESQQFIESKPLCQLFDLEMKKQEKKMVEEVQICRICSQGIKMINIQKHVNNCAKKSSLKMQLELKNQEINALQDTLKVLFTESCEEYTHQKIDEQFRRICKLILHPERKVHRVLHRRSSLIGLKSQKSLHNKIEQSIIQYIETYGQHIILSNLLRCFNERSLIERGINHLQMNNLMSDHYQGNSIFERKTKKTDKLERKNSKKNTCEIKPRCHFFQIEPQQENEQIDKPQKLLNKRKGSISSKKTDSIQKQDKIEDENLIDIVLTKRSLSRKNHRVSKDSQFNEIKHYSSLHDINPSLIKSEFQQSKIRLNSFQILKFLGQGAFGKVYMVRRKQTKDIYALKIIKISENYGEKEFQSIKNENQIFKKIAGDHLVKAPFSFNEQSSHIFILQYMPGGDLRKILTDEVYLEEEGAKFYLAQIILAIQYLHKHNIIHRDLKPQNLVIDRMGHLKLTDFGLSEFQVHQKLRKTRKQHEMNEAQRSRSRKTRKRRTALYGVNKNNIKLIGTPDYIAPQIINQTSLSNFTIDWWSLGVMAYEMIIGTRPFCGDTIQDIIDNITNFNIEWPEVGFEEGMITPDAKDFIMQLLNKDFVNRLGANGAHQLKNHPFLKGIDWENLKSSTPTVLPRNVTKIKDLVNLKEDPSLRKEVQEFIKNGKEKSNKIKLKTFIRFDLLRSETIQNVEKKQQMTTKKLNRLKTLKQITNQTQQNAQGCNQ